MDDKMKAAENEIILIYNSEKQRDREVLGYVQAVKKYAVNEKDISRDNLTETQLAEVADQMGKPVESLVDKNSEKYLNELESRSLADEEILKILSKNADVINSPIVMMKDKVFIVDSQYSLIQEGLDTDGVQSNLGNEFEK